MEFYDELFHIEANYIVSIPNGMEFYKDKGGGSGKGDGFQFPTGWSSTKRGLGIDTPASRVSIPNGMEFYD